MAVMKELDMDLDDLLDNAQKCVHCGRAMLDALEEILLQFANRRAQYTNVGHTAPDTIPVEGPAEPMQPQEEGLKAATLEEVRAILTEKSRNGYRAEVKALLTAFGATKLTEITDPAELGRLLAKAETIGNGQ